MKKGDDNNSAATIETKALDITGDENKKILIAIYQKICGGEGAEKGVDVIVNTVKQSNKNEWERIRAEMQETIKEGISEYSDALTASAKKTNDKHSEENSALWKLMFWVSIFFCVLGGLIGGYMGSHLGSKLDSDVEAKLEAGAFYQSLWPKLSKSDQDRLIAIEQGKMMEKPDKKSKNG